MATKYPFESLGNLYHYYNVQLFNKELPYCSINLYHVNGYGPGGYLAFKLWGERIERVINEISLEPGIMKLPDEYWHCSLVHEMCHFWQQVFGKPSRYHNQEWANKMISVGLMPSHNGKPGGKKTGYTMAEYVIKGGVFDIAFSKISVEDLDRLKLPYSSDITVRIPITNPRK